MRCARFPSLGILGALGGAAMGALVPSDASGGWPPPMSASAADMADPANWPNDPAYGTSATQSGQWIHYSFLPTPGGSVRPEESAAGMSIDLAWRLTQGDPDVRIAITDSGILWGEVDLLEKAWINHGELAQHKPTRADGAPCGGAGALAGFDCNGDGILTVSDYKDTPALSSGGAPDARPAGDKNRNGRLDAGDLILLFSDGLDDDRNGYADDIAGWDFVDDDNDPSDDTRSGHGTEGAKTAAAQTNNQVGGAGACPRCRFIPLRVGDSHVADAQDVAKAILYATDAEVAVVQCPVSAVDNTSFLQEALDYAYREGTLVVTSVGNVSSRHHGALAINNHTLPVGAVRHDKESAAASTTFVDAAPCSSFGGQSLLSGSTPGCSSEATAGVAGVAGLLHSLALEHGVVLSPGEMRGLLVATADDISVPESQRAGSPFRWSQPGFDQRFGFGRVNANRAAEAIERRRIPPSVDITSPRWFKVLYKDQAQGPIRIEGTVSARRASTFDYAVEWAPGVQPRDEDFRLIRGESNVDSAITIGNDGPIASLDVRTIDTAHARDADSPRGENDRAITVRIRALAHYGGNIGEVRGEARRTYYVVDSDPTLVFGFPFHIGDSGEGSPKLADLDGDGRRELIYPSAGGALHVLEVTLEGPKPRENFPFLTDRIGGLNDDPSAGPGAPSYLGAAAYSSTGVEPKLGREPILSAPAIADLDGDGAPEIVFSTWPGKIYVIDALGELKDGWPKRLPEVSGCSFGPGTPVDPGAPTAAPCSAARTARGALASPVLADLDGNGQLEVIQAAFDGKVHAFDARGKALSGWPVEVHYEGPLAKAPARSRLLATPAVADFNGDGLPDLLVGSSERLGAGGQAGAVYVIDARGEDAPPGPVLAGWPVTTASRALAPLAVEGITASGVIGRFGGALAGVVHGSGALPLVLPASPGAQEDLLAPPAGALPPPRGGSQGGLDPAFGPLSAAAGAQRMFPLLTHPSLGDIDQDGTPDVIASGGSEAVLLNLAGERAPGSPEAHLLAVWSGSSGAMLPSAPFVLEDHMLWNSQAVVDLNGDDYPEVLTGSSGYFLHAFDGCGREPRGFPKFTGQSIATTPAVGDLDGDGSLEVVVGTRDGWLFAWHTEATEDAIIAWESFHHDNRNTGNLETPLEQGGQRRAARPLTAEICAGPPPEEPVLLRLGGGCTCAVPGSAPRRGGGDRGASAALAGALLGAAALWRRRRRV
ncbi:alkaline serine protease [Sorangium cellulosum]|uniref:Alkaline serine protease n=1 Tax=Sorangium cellulosum TaxID=56 RepID=A0A2L0F251_SORCE|nr:FG-GAP-like repeat-containing protein [Sorangium cellulosum]AUX45626.1 alkaline serine protease [Sorangium cellulosum]